MNIRIKHKLLIVFILFYYSVSYSQGSWISINSPTNQFLKSVDFVDSLYGWAVGDSGTIIHTSDGGFNWLFQQSNLSYSIEDVFFLNRDIGWAIAWKSDAPPFGTYILNTTNGGLTWQSSAYREENIFINCILFLDSLTGWMGGDPHALVKTTNGGISWEQAEIDTINLAFFPVFSIVFYNEQYGYACGGAFDIAGVTWRTTNGGDMWFPIDTSDAPAEPVRALHIFDSLNVIGISGGFEPIFAIDLIRTSDGGVFWEYESLTYTGAPQDLDFSSDTEVWVPITTDRTFIVSTDAGTTWEQIATPETTAIYDINFPDSLHGFAVGEQGAILKYNPPIVDDIDFVGRTVPNSFQLYQNYPNPFNPTTKIKFTIPDIGTRPVTSVQLRVYDILGNEVAILVNKELPEGIYEVDFEAKDANEKLTSGVYFYQLKTEKFIETKKMILLR